MEHISEIYDFNYACAVSGFEWTDFIYAVVNLQILWHFRPRPYSYFTPLSHLPTKNEKSLKSVFKP
jgi:hypothetical protein